MKQLRQCELTKGTYHRVVWVPVEFCRVGASWEGWQVLVVWPHTIRCEDINNKGDVVVRYVGDGE